MRGMSVATSVDHYENFPVASWFVPARLRGPLAAIYSFARHADDIADEGDVPADQRLRDLDELERALPMHDGGPAVVARLRPHLQSHNLPLDPFRALLSAFRQDVSTSRYDTREQIDDYCRRSADPVGEIVLRLFGAWAADTARPSSNICTALQRINFLQDVASDWQRGRLYLPIDALAAAGLEPDDVGRAVALGRADDALRRMLQQEARHCRELLHAGLPLVRQVPRRLGWELRAIVAGADRVLDRFEAGGCDPIAHRPRLRWTDAPALVAGWLRLGSDAARSPSQARDNAR